MAQRHEGGFDPGAADRLSLNELVGRVVHNLQAIFRAEMRLAGAELKEKMQKSVKAGALLGGAAVMGLLAAMCLVTACIVALAIVLPLWLSAVLVCVMLAAGAGAAYMLGRLALQEVDPIPRQTVDSLQELVDWSRTRSR
jgi:uncharacterized membrane protein YqjE